MSVDLSVIFTLLAAGALSFYFFNARRLAWANDYIVRIQALAAELSNKARNLDKARETAKQSNDAALRRAREFSLLTSETARLRTLVTQLKSANESLATDAAVKVATAEDLRRRLAASERAKAQLERDVSDSRDAHLELVSRIHVDDRQRVSALNRLRRPHQYHYPSSNDSPDAGGSTPSPAPSSDLGVLTTISSTMMVAKSPSESFLLGLHPNLAPDASDDELDLDPPVFQAKPPRAASPPMSTKKTAGTRRRARTNGARRPRGGVALELPRAPWVDAVHGEAARQSLAHALAGVTEDVPGVCRSRGDGSASESVSAD